MRECRETTFRTFTHARMAHRRANPGWRRPRNHRDDLTVWPCLPCNGFHADGILKMEAPREG